MTTFPELVSMLTSAANEKAMSPRSDLGESGWTFWERRTVNIHRVVGLMRGKVPFPDAHTLDAELRSAFARNFKRAWWRGIAYGAVASAELPALSPDHLKVLVDGYENSKGTMQWVVLVSGDGRKATGVHTWIEGYLSPVYRAVLYALQQKGCEVASVRKEKDGLMRLLTGVADGRARVLTGRAAFPEFRDPFVDPKAAAADSRNGHRPETEET